jgi:hypothetical protein
MSYYHITLKSNNRKTGDMVVVTSSRDTCPSVCPFRKSGCYALGGPLRLHWNKVSEKERGYSFDEFLERIKEISEGKLIRLWQAGDMPGRGNIINFGQVKRLVEVLQPHVAYGYTHKPMDLKDNSKAVKYCNDNGVCINLSANNVEHADELMKLKIAPVSITLPSDCKEKIYTPKRNRIIICPAVLNKDFHCNECGSGKPLCSRTDRNYIVGFPAHGNSIRKVNEIVSQA